MYYEALEVDFDDRKDSRYICFAITDTGIGISPEDQEKLFQPFVQVDSKLNRKYEGTGLGLALVKQIVELHGGNVSLRSELNQGSCFTVSLPYNFSALHTQEISPTHPLVVSEPDKQIHMTENSPEQQVASEFYDSTATNSPLILLAEDNEANIMTISSYLEAKAYRVIIAKNGVEAIAIAKAEHPDLILMDIQMPVMDGLEAIAQIRLDPSLIEIPIVALTALAMEGDRDRCLAAGANEYISKPIRLKQLDLLMQKLL